MSYYHYTSLSALEGILQKNENDEKALCFWATRYDCFGDEDEYLLGIDYAEKYLSIMEEARKIPEENRIAWKFKRQYIENNAHLPYPYTISLTTRNNNAYMWKNYADNNNGVVLEIELPHMKGGYDSAILYKLEKCIYDGTVEDTEIDKIIYEVYTDGGLELINSKMEFGIDLLRSPKALVQLIAMYILAFFAPRIKGNRFKDEEEFRIILSIPIPAYTKFLLDNAQILNPIADTLHAKIRCEDVARTISDERIRLKDDKQVYYREFYLPKSSLCRIFVTNEQTESKVKNILQQKGFNNIEVCSHSHHRCDLNSITTNILR